MSLLLDTHVLHHHIGPAASTAGVSVSLLLDTYVLHLDRLADVVLDLPGA